MKVQGYLHVTVGYSGQSRKLRLIVDGLGSTFLGKKWLEYIIIHLNWATISKVKNGKIHMCGDYKLTLNPVMEVDQYLLPRMDDLFAMLAGKNYQLSTTAPLSISPKIDYL